MGLSSSQVRLLALTSRKADNELETQHCANQKEALAREMDKVSLNYKNALSQKVLKWSNNSGIDYVDLSYSALMRPSKANGNVPVLITNSEGKIAIDKKYKEYAEMISKDGKSGGDYSGDTRINILSALTGISKETLANADSTEASADVAYENLQKAEKDLGTFCNKNRRGYSQSQFCALMGIDKKAEITSLNVESYLNTAKTAMKDFLRNSDYALFEKACEAAKNYVSTKETSENDSKITGEDLANYLYGAYKQANVNNYTASRAEDGNLYAFARGKAPEYEEKLAAYNEAKKTYESAFSSNKQVLTGPQEKQIDFYDKLFTAISECGWKYDESLGDDEYLNQMFQNNQFMITTMVENDADCGCDCDGNPIKTNEYLYNTDLWSDTNNIFAVNDENLRQEALVDYEHEKFVINAKEKRIDTRMKNLETEYNAIQKMIESISKVKDDNIENFFSIFS